jgi:hypothetical protein
VKTRLPQAAANDSIVEGRKTNNRFKVIRWSATRLFIAVTVQTFCTVCLRFAPTVGLGLDTSPSASERRGSEPDTRLWRDLIGSGMAGFGRRMRKAAARLWDYRLTILTRNAACRGTPIERLRRVKASESSKSSAFWKEPSPFLR